MTRNKIFIFIFLLLAFIISFVNLTFDIFDVNNSPQIYNISVIVRGKNSDSWASIKEGADQAASEMHVDLSFITLAEENSLSEQRSLLNREYMSGVDAIVLSAANSEKLAQPIEKIADKIPIVCIESPVESSLITSYVSADNYAMGVQLANQILSLEKVPKHIAVVEANLNCMNVQQRLSGITSVLEEKGGIIDHWKVSDNSANAVMQLDKYLKNTNADVIVALDLTTLELTAQAVSDSQLYNFNLFGIGASGKVASFIEKGTINTTIVQNDFGIGYLGVKAAVDALENRKVSKTILIEHRFINRDNMFDSESQRLLFPFIR